MDRTNDKPCRLCGQLIHPNGILSHAYWKHRVDFDLWINSKAGFGGVESEHVGESRRSRMKQKEAETKVY